MVQITSIESSDLVRSRAAKAVRSLALGCPQCGVKSPFGGPWFSLTLAGIRRFVVQIRSIEKSDLVRSRAAKAARSLALGPHAGSGFTLVLTGIELTAHPGSVRVPACLREREGE